MDIEELERKKQLLQTLKRTKHEYDLQAAEMRVHTPPYVNTERKRLAQEIEQLESEIALSQRRPSLPPRSTLRDPFYDMPKPIARRTLEERSHRPPVPERRLSDALPPIGEVEYAPPSTLSPKNSNEGNSPLRNPRLLLLLATISTIIFLFTFIPPPRPNVSVFSPNNSLLSQPTQNSISGIAAPSEPITTLSVGQTWISDTVTLGLQSVTYDNDTIIIKWRLTNNSPNNLTFPVASYTAIGASAINGVAPIAGISCEGFDCNADLSLETGKSAYFTHILKYNGLQVSGFTGQLLVTSGITTKAHWSIGQ